MKKPILLFIVTIAIAFASCHHDGKTNKDNQQESSFDIAKMVKDFENYDCYECPNRDTVSFMDDVDLLMEYCKKPNLKLAPNVERFLDSISEYTGIPVHMPDEPEDELGLVHRAVHELRRFQTGERAYYPEKEIMTALDCMGFGLGDIWSHEGDIWYISMYYWYCFATQAALLSPNIEFVSHTHSPDYQLGLLSYHEWSPLPMMSFLVMQKNNYCTVQLIDEEVNLKKIFQIKDKQEGVYYLLTSRSGRIIYDPMDAYLYKKSTADVSYITKGSLSYTSFLNNHFFDLIPVESDEWGNTVFDIVYSDFAFEQAQKNNMSQDAFLDSLRIIFNPHKYQWDLCIRNGGEYWHKIEGTRSMYLHIDEKDPYFEIH